MSRLDSARESLAVAQRKCSHLEAELRDASRASADIANTMRESGEYDRRIARLRVTLRQHEDQNKRVDLSNRLRRVAAFLPAVILVLLGLIDALRGINPLRDLLTVSGVIGLFAILAAYVGLIKLGSWIWPRRYHGSDPESTTVGLLDAHGSSAQVRTPEAIENGVWRTAEELEAVERAAQQRHALACAQENLRKAESVYTEEYQVSLMAPEKQTAYWTRKRYDLEAKRAAAEEEFQDAVLMELEETAERDRDNAAVQERLLREQFQWAKEQAEKQQELARQTEKAARRTAEETKRLRRVEEDKKRKDWDIFV